VTQVESFSPRRSRRTPEPTSPGDDGGAPAPTRRPSSDRYAPEPYPVDDFDRRGSHATIHGDGFSWVLLWTILGALVPGAGLLAAGRRRLGGLLLGLIGLLFVGLIGFVLLGDPRQAGISLALDPTKLMLLAVGSAVVALVWVLVIVFTNAQLRQYATMTTVQNVFSGIVVVALLIGVALPAYKVGSYALITRSVVTNTSVFGGGSADSDASGGPNAKKADPWASKPQMNVLLLGSDAGADRTGIRPDTMILASVNTKTGKTAMFSLPRSMQHAPFAPGTPGAKAWPNGYYCPDQSCLLNAIWTWADTGAGKPYYKQYKNPGLKATEDAIEGVTGQKIDTYVMLNLNGFKDFVDALGGVTVDVHDRLPIGGNGDVHSSNYHKATGGYIEIGNNQHLDGYHALWFARSRWAFDDYNRMQRQRCVIGDVVDQANPAKLALNFPAIAKALKKNLQTGIKPADLQAWVTLAQRVQKGGVRSLVFDPDVIRTYDPDFPKIHQLVADAVKGTAKVDAPKTAATTAATPTPGATKKATTTKKKDPAKAQSLKSVC
jgi:LCP family protein required for cell wall assembly